MPVSGLRAPKFTEKEVDMCLSEAAMLRGSYLHPNDFTYDAEDKRVVGESRAWDRLAGKIAKLVGLKEFEKRCAHCENGKNTFGDNCLYCLGTGLWPPTKDGKRVFPELRK